MLHQTLFLRGTVSLSRKTFIQLLPRTEPWLRVGQEACRGSFWEQHRLFSIFWFLSGRGQGKYTCGFGSSPRITIGITVECRAPVTDQGPVMLGAGQTHKKASPNPGREYSAQSMLFLREWCFEGHFWCLRGIWHWSRTSISDIVSHELWTSWILQTCP